MDVVDALVVIAGRVTYEHLVASIDSALHTGVLSARQLDVLFTRLPGRLRFARALVDRRSESGIESLFRIAAIEQGWDVQVQVEIDGLGRADHVINGWLIIETDGDEHHSTKEQRANDRRRDAIAVRRGMRAHRFGYRQIMDDLDACIEVVADILAAGRPYNACTRCRARPRATQASRAGTGRSCLFPPGRRFPACFRAAGWGGSGSGGGRGSGGGGVGAVRGRRPGATAGSASGAPA
jgi:very-short-patch-repair endonuclease